MRRWIVPAVLGAFVLASAPADARTISSKTITFSAPVACAVACPYALGLDETGDDVPEYPLDTCRNPGPPQSFADHVVKAPRGARALIFSAYPKGDWDIFVCAKPRTGNNGRLLRTGFVGFVGVKETIRMPVKEGRRYVLRGYNFLDASSLRARYWFIG